jgi:hypothetical protein
MPLMTGGMSGGSAVPFQRTVDPGQLGMFINLDAAEMMRIRRIAEAQRFYLGQQWQFQREDGEALVTINYLRKLIDKSVEFLAAEGFSVTVPKAMTQVTLPFLTEVWGYNGQSKFAWDSAIVGAITGDVFVMVTYEEPSEMTKRIKPFSQGKIKIQLLNSEQVFPTWDPLDRDRLLSVRIETLYYADKGLNDLSGDRNHQGRNLYTKRFTQIITPDEIVEQLHGELPLRKKNLLGEIPLVHWQNISMPGEFYGISDAMGLIELQREYNEKSTDVSDTINYQGSPVTVITGGKAKQLERGPKQIWSGLPADAKVYNLGLEGDLSAAQGYRDSILRSMFELSDVPEGSLGKIQPVSNTSGVALHTQYEPLIKKTLKKRALYEPGIERINYFVLRLGVLMGLVRLPYDVCTNCGGRIVETPTGKTEIRWISDFTREEGGYFGQVAVTKKRCFEVDPETLEFRSPEEMRLSFVKEYGFGSEVREAPYWSILRFMAQGKPSFWDYASDDLLNQKAHEAGMASVDQLNQSRVTDAVLNPPPPPPPAAGGTGGAPDAVPMGMVPPPPPPMRRTQVLPPTFIDVPEEPEMVSVVTRYTDPASGVVISESTENRFLVPTKCLRPAYLDPYETEVQYHETLPKDEAQQQQLYMGWLQGGIVDTEWIQDRVPEIAEDVEELRERMRKVRGAMGTSPGPMGEVPFNELAPPPQPGKLADSGPQGGAAAKKTEESRLVASQSEMKSK